MKQVNDPNLPLVSIITPSFNSGRFIECMIKSVLKQDYPNLEHIVVDGGSTDSTLTILDRYPHLIWVSEPDNGQSDALNKGFKMAKGEIFGWLNADDTYNSCAISEAVSHLTKNPETVMVYSNCKYVDENNNTIFYHKVPSFDLATQVIDYQLPQPTVFFRAEVLNSVGYLHQDLHYVMDWDFFLRIGLNRKVDHVNAVWANFRVWHDTKTSSQPEMFWQEILDVYDHFFSNPNLPPNINCLRNIANARAYWRLGCIYHAKFRAHLMELGIESCNKALHIFPLLDIDRDFVISQIVHWAINEVQPDYYENYTLNIVSNLGIPKKDEFKLRKEVLSQIYVNAILHTKVGKKLVNEISIEEQRRLLIKAIMQDLKWIKNRRIQSQAFHYSLDIIKGLFKTFSINNRIKRKVK